MFRYTLIKKKTSFLKFKYGKLFNYEKLTTYQSHMQLTKDNIMDDAIDWIPGIHLIVTVKCSHSKIKPLWDNKK